VRGLIPVGNLTRILSYIRPYKGRMIVAYISLFAALGIQLIIPIVLADAIDHGVKRGDDDYLLRSALGIVGLVVLQGLFTFGRVYLINTVSERVGFDIRQQLYSHLQVMPFSYYDRAQTGQLMSRATEDINSIRVMLQVTLRTIPLMTGTFIGVTIVLLRIDWLLTIVAVGSLPFLMAGAIRYEAGIRPLFLRVQQQFGVMTSALQENVAGGRVVRAFAQEKNEITRFETELSELFGRNLATARRWSFTYSLLLALSGGGLAAVLWLGGYRVLSGAMTVGTLVAFNRYLILVAEPIRWLGFVVNRIARARASAERIFEIFDTRPKIANRKGAVALKQIAGEVVFEDVTFRFAGARRDALSGVSFTARPGETVAIVGPTGAGKSAIVNLIPRFYDVTDGRVTVDGHDVRDVTLHSLRSQVGMVLQETFLFAVTIEENIAFGRPGASHDEVVAAAKAAQIHAFIETLPEGYRTVVGERGVSLSGGQKQRVAIARAILQDPRILILDDATSSVDSQTEEAIQTALRTLLQGRTAFVIAQRLDTVRDADQILVLQDGRIVERGTHMQLLQRGGFYHELYDLQRKVRGEEEALGDAEITATVEDAEEVPVVAGDG
jgi:ATP-binding cassette subfamily B multidrug efflux pump